MAVTLKRRSQARPSPDSMTLIEHLAELRRRLIIVLAAVAAGAIVVYILYPQILRFFLHPYCIEAHLKGSHCALTVFSPLAGFAVRLNTTAYGALGLALPVIVFELWRFVTPGLKANEKKYAVPFTVATVALFGLGCYIAWLTFPHALGFLNAVSGPNIHRLFTPSAYLSLILALMAIFGLTFEFPVVLVGLELARVVSPQRLARWRKWAIVLIVVFAGVITPSSDPFSMLALAIPMIVFYEGSIQIGKLINRRRERVAAA
jgi:sec-independent protein translocase protein TatC